MAKRRKKKEVVAPVGQGVLPEHGDIVGILQGYKQEAKDARKGGMNPRDAQWETNINAYWGRYDFSKKAGWQAKEVMPEVPSFVDRFAASLKEALITSPSGFYQVRHPGDPDDNTGLGKAVKRATDVWLSQCGANQQGTPLSFPAVFEEQCKLGAMMACCSTVTWKTDVPGGRVSIESFDPRTLWLDHTMRNLYRVRQIELDKHELVKMAKETDKAGKSIWNLPAIEMMVSDIGHEAKLEREALTGTSQDTSSTRKPVVMDEYLATVVASDGKVLAENALMVVGNGKHLIRGPEANPFWHKRDWVVYAPLVTTPLSAYGRAYMEDFASLAKTFNNMTNLILDAVQTSSIRAYAVVPGMLVNPGQIAEGLWPNKMFELVEGQPAKDFFAALELGTLPPESVQIWQALKNELMEAAGRNEIGLGQFAPNSRTSATEISSTQASTSALVRSVAQTIETRYLNLKLDLVWKTGFQHVMASDTAIQNAVSSGGTYPQLFPALMARRKEFVSQPFTFQANGITAIIAKNQTLRALMGLFQMIGASEALMQAFLEEASVQKVMRLLFELSDVDFGRLAISEQERLVKQFAPPQMMQGAPSGSPPGIGAARQEMGGITRRLGIGR